MTVRARSRGGNTTADNAVDVLLLFSEKRPLLSAAEVSELLDMPRSTTYRYLRTLRSSGLLEEDDGGGYRLGPRILQLARVARQDHGLHEVALPVMRDLAARTQEAVLLTRRLGTQVICVERVESTHPVRLSYERGHVLPVHAGASAKVLLAFSEPSEIDLVLAGPDELPRFTDRTVTDPAALRAQLSLIRERGYAVSDGEVDVGVRGVAAPVFDHNGRLAAGLSVAGPSFRLTDEVSTAVVVAVREAAARISERLRDLER